MSFESDKHASAYWKENVRLMLTLLCIWFAVSFGFPLRGKAGLAHRNHQ
jgi:uncharacterized membrane protein